MLTQGFKIELDQLTLNVNTAFLEHFSNCCTESVDPTTQYQTIAYSDFKKLILEHITHNKYTEPVCANDVIHKFFPINKSFDVFISHSHLDVNYAKMLKSYIETESKQDQKDGLKAFVDDGYWRHYDELVKRFKNEYPKISYEELFKHIFVILQSALTHMIVNFRTFVYLKSENTENNLGIILSPIIYHELSMFNLILSLSNKVIMNEAYKQMLSVEYDAKSDLLSSVGVREFINILKAESTENE